MDVTFAELFKRYGLVLFSAVGALIGVSFVERLTVVAAGIGFLASFAFAVVAAPIVVYYVDPPLPIRDHVLAGLAGLFGLVGFMLCGTVFATVQHARSWVPEFVRKLIERRWGR
jgi:tellurite resistance protein TehA-like permease